VTGVPSPCVSVCRMEPDGGLCEGCLRTLDEIAAWAVLDERGKQGVWKLIHERRALRAGSVATAAPAAGEAR
jgi:uncharacterized protein